MMAELRNELDTAEILFRVSKLKNDKKNKDLVSIITPSYNSSKYISQTIESVISQTYQNWEMIIIDDCSTDDSIYTIEKYLKKDMRIKLIKLEKKSGPAVARNKGIKEANGRYIAFLDADDIWLSEKLEKQINFMKKERICFCYSSYYVIDEKGFEIGLFITKKEATYKELLKTCFIGNLTAIYDASNLGKIYMEPIPVRQDYTLWLKILRNGAPAKGILEPLAKYRLRYGSISSNKIKATIWTWQIYRNIEKLTLYESIYY